jgi:mRNA-degrading endonuclease toxin of MazEF toxin-antitoxin module
MDVARQKWVNSVSKYTPGHLGQPQPRLTTVVNVSQVITVDKSFLAERVGKLNTQQLSEVEDGLRLILGV